MTTRYYAEDPCLECGRFDAHDEHGWFGPLRRELTIDYEAATQELIAVSGLTLPISQMAQAVVDSALGGPDA